MYFINYYIFHNGFAATLPKTKQHLFILQLSF